MHTVNADCVSESQTPCPLTAAQDASLGKDHLVAEAQDKEGELCSQQFCSMLGVWPTASHEFSVPASSLEKMMTMMSFLSSTMSTH